MNVPSATTEDQTADCHVLHVPLDDIGQHSQDISMENIAQATEAVCSLARTKQITWTYAQRLCEAIRENGDKKGNS